MSSDQPGKDIHRETAALLYGVDLADVTAEQRSRARTINYKLHYMTDLELDKLFIESTHVLTRRAKIKLFFQSLWYPWPLRRFTYEVFEPGFCVELNGWLHENGTVYLTRIWVHGA